MPDIGGGVLNFKLFRELSFYDPCAPSCLATSSRETRFMQKVRRAVEKGNTLLKNKTRFLCIKFLRLNVRYYFATVKIFVAGFESRSKPWLN